MITFLFTVILLETFLLNINLFTLNFLYVWPLSVCSREYLVLFLICKAISQGISPRPTSTGNCHHLTNCVRPSNTKRKYHVEQFCFLGKNEQAVGFVRGLTYCSKEVFCSVQVLSTYILYCTLHKHYYLTKIKVEQ